MVKFPSGTEMGVNGMLQHEEKTINNIKLIRTYSDINMKIKQMETGILYDEATDLYESSFSYEETNIPIDEHDVPIPPEPESGAVEE